jgi:hypothetical protein
MFWSYDDVPDIPYEEMAEKLFGLRYLDDLDDRIWELARNSNEIPHFGNIKNDLLLYDITQELEDKYKKLNIETDYFINAIDTHLSIDQEEMHSLIDFRKMLETLDERLVETEEETDEKIETESKKSVKKQR